MRSSKIRVSSKISSLKNDCGLPIGATMIVSLSLPVGVINVGIDTDNAISNLYETVQRYLRDNNYSTLKKYRKSSRRQYEVDYAITFLLLQKYHLWEDDRVPEELRARTRNHKYYVYAPIIGNNYGRPASYLSEYYSEASGIIRELFTPGWPPVQTQVCRCGEDKCRWVKFCLRKVFPLLLSMHLAGHMYLPDIDNPAQIAAAPGVPARSMVITTGATRHIYISDKLPCTSYVVFDIPRETYDTILADLGDLRPELVKYSR